MSLDYSVVFISTLLALFSEFSDFDEVGCSGRDGHIAATNPLPVYDVCLFGRLLQPSSVFFFHTYSCIL